MSNLFLVFFLLILISCSHIIENKDGYEKYSNRIISEYIKKIKQKGDIYPIAIGGKTSGGVQCVFLTFESKAFHTIESSRKLIVEMEQELISMINNSLEIRPFLYQCPVQDEIFKLTLGFVGEDNFFVSPPFIAIASICNGNVRYSTLGPKKEGPFENVHIETYDEAYRIVYGKDRNK